MLYGDHRDLHVLTHSFPTRRASDRPRRNQGGTSPPVTSAGHSCAKQDLRNLSLCSAPNLRMPFADPFEHLASAERLPSRLLEALLVTLRMLVVVAFPAMRPKRG